ncbi:hypothetical protein AVEN_154848-1 [Araneus ventricosus]|uniref:Uncharacterized protein n=1 Tax=Araneus ventricosus TaxID=182803 RepID=A0A4Y2BU55_ARAVE|nr:hypothetical protein AVEN_154848-1 [Araneus ventricosus]
MSRELTPFEFAISFITERVGEFLPRHLREEYSQESSMRFGPLPAERFGPKFHIVSLFWSQDLKSTSIYLDCCNFDLIAFTHARIDKSTDGQPVDGFGSKFDTERTSRI